MGRRSLRIPVLPRSLRVGGVVLVAAVIVYFSLFDSPGGPGPLPMGPLGLVHLDKWYHAAGYAALGGALGYATLDVDARTLAAIFLLAAGYGVAIELVQAPLPDRAFSYADMGADALGALLGLAVWRVLVAVRLVEIE